jgi:hypothetical protein
LETRLQELSIHRSYTKFHIHLPLQILSLISLKILSKCWSQRVSLYFLIYLTLILKLSLYFNNLHSYLTSPIWLRTKTLFFIIFSYSNVLSRILIHCGPACCQKSIPANTQKERRKNCGAKVAAPTWFFLAFLYL